MSFQIKNIKHKFRTLGDKEAWIEKYATVKKMRVAKLSEQQNHHCCYCGVLTWLYDGTGKYQYPLVPDRLLGMGEKQKATAEHLIPLSKGGKDNLANMIMACDRCNNHRGNKPAIKYFEALQIGGVKLKYFSKIKHETDEEKFEKRERKDKKTAVLLGCLYFISPTARQLGDEIMTEIELKLGGSLSL